MKQFDMGKAFSFAFQTLKKYYLLLLGPVIFLNFFFQTYLYFTGENPTKTDYISKLKIFPEITSNSPVYVKVILLVLVVILIILATVIAISLEIGRMKIAFHVFNQKEDDLTWNVYRNSEKGLILRYVLAFSLLSLMLIISYLFLFIPAIIVSLMFQFTLLILVEKHTKIIESFKISYRLTNGIKNPLFGYSILAGCISLPFVVPLYILQYFNLHHYALILNIFIIPTLSLFFSLGMIYIYKEISSQVESLDRLIEESKTKKDDEIGVMEIQNTN